MKVSTTLNNNIFKLLNQYMKRNEIENRSKALADLITKALLNEEYLFKTKEIDTKLNRILFHENMTKKILDQMYVNFGFPKNQDVKKNKLLGEFDEKNNYYEGRNFLNE